MSQEKQLIRTLKQELISLTGNKVYYRDLESLFDKISSMELDPNEKSALRHLSTDIRRAKNQKNQSKPGYPPFI